MDVVYDAIIGAVNLRQVRRTTFEPNVQTMRGRVSGGVDTAEIYAMSGEPRARFESMDLAGVIAGIPLTTGLFVTGGTITLPWNRRVNGGTFAGGASHLTLTGSIGLTIPLSVSASQGDEGAAVELETAFLSSNGLLLPVSAAVNQALGAQAYNAAYAMGPFYINGAELSEVVSVRVNTGLQMELRAYSGGLYPIRANITSRDPSMEITFSNFDALSTQGPLFTALSSCAAYFRKKVDGGSFVADASLVHAKLSFTTGITTVQQAGADGQNSGQATLRVEGKALTATSVSAIP